jgi:hypothetical protein
MQNNRTSFRLNFPTDMTAMHSGFSLGLACGTETLDFYSLHRAVIWWEGFDEMRFRAFWLVQREKPLRVTPAYGTVSFPLITTPVIGFILRKNKHNCFTLTHYPTKIATVETTRLLNSLYPETMNLILTVIGSSGGLVYETQNWYNTKSIKVILTLIRKWKKQS